MLSEVKIHRANGEEITLTPQEARSVYRAVELEDRYSYVLARLANLNDTADDQFIEDLLDRYNDRRDESTAAADEFEEVYWDMEEEEK